MLSAVAVLLVWPTLSSAAVAEEELWTKCQSGSGAGQCRIPRGVAAYPGTGHVFIADFFNARIVELTAAGAFVKAWGWDVVATGPGDDTAAPEDQFEICVPAKGDTCKAGLEGTGAGQLIGPEGVAIDSSGNVYVVDLFNFRVQKFDAEGNFLLMFGDEVNKGPIHPGDDLCTTQHITEGDTCGAGVKGGAGEGQFGWSGANSASFIAIDGEGTNTAADDDVYVGDANRIQIFGTSGLFTGEVPKDPKGALKEATVKSLAIDTAGMLYVAYVNLSDVRKLNPVSGEELDEPRFEIALPTAVAVDPIGNVYAFGLTSLPGGIPLDPICKFASTGNQIECFGKSEFKGSTGLATNLCPGNEAPGNLYVTNFDLASGVSDFVRAYGTPPTKCGKAITGEATNITETSATLNAQANPKGEAVSECLFEYGTTTIYGQTTPCAESSGEIGTGEEPVPVHADISGLTDGTVYHFRLVVGAASGTEEGEDTTFKTLGPPVINAEHTVGATDTEATIRALVNPEGLATSCHFEYGTTIAYGQIASDQPVGSDRKEHVVQTTLKGLESATTYHWQIVCANSSGGVEGADRTATTFPSPSEEPDTCPNAALRTGAAAFLPDCRGYEMVSPVDKNGGPLTLTLRTTIQVSPDGEKVSYQALPSFAGQPRNLPSNQYLAVRGDVGWSSHGIESPFNGDQTGGVQLGIAREIIAFSLDLCDTWLVDYQDPPPTADGQKGFRNLYRRQNCEPGVGDLEALTPDPPTLPGNTPQDYVDAESVHGYSQDGNQVVFVARGALPHTPEAAPGTNAQVYHRANGQLKVVSILPSGSADGSGAQVGSGWNGSLENAVSADGSRVYWTGSGGKVFVRTHPERGKVEGECSEASKACTTAVSAGSAAFWAGTVDGSKALYSEGSLTEGKAKLVEFELAGGTRRTVANNVRGVLGSADDLSHVYFVSRDAIPGTGANSEGDEAEAGKPNVYLDQEGTLSFVGTVSEKDLGGKEPGALAETYSLVTLRSRERPTRVTPGGEHLVFQSRASLTGFDNTDADGRPAMEVFRYEAGGELECVSCNPGGAQPLTDELNPPFEPGWTQQPNPTFVSAAAWISGWERPLYDSKVLSDSGGRVFFNSHDALVPRDGNGAMDVYEWEAPGEGSCTSDSPAFFASNGGCIYLISTGESPIESEFWGASPDGDNVFFTTESKLAPQDPGLIDLYNARVGGGFPPPIVREGCEGETCQSPPLPPAFTTPGSSSFQGPGDEKTTKPRPRRCRKGKRRVRRGGKARCVKRRGGAKARRASADRGVGR